MLIGYVKQSQFWLIGSFLVLIAASMLLLKLCPGMMQGGVELDWSDALFTATSAVCVTGMTTVPVAQFSPFGQILILILVQIGGLGFMTLTASILLWLGGGMNFGNTMIMSSLSDNFSLRHTEGLLRTVLRYSLAIEAVGAVLLSFGFWMGGYGWLSLWYGLFHAVTSFCNAGFSPLPHSLIGVPAMVKIVSAVLIIAGGIGFYVIYDLFHMRHRLGTLKIHTQLVLITSGILLVAGMFGLCWFEHCDGHSPLPWLDAFFLSASTRSAGFVTVDLHSLSQDSIALLTILMLIGASPGSTGGGIKTTVVALAALAVINTFCGNRRVLIFRREIAIDYILKSFTIIITFLLLVLLGAAVLSSMMDGTVQDVFFETASALSTAGMSSGLAQPGMPYGGKILLIIYMFIGRIGPFTIFLFLLGREKVTRIRYPEERIIIG